MSTSLKGREVHLASRPEGAPTEQNFTLVEVPVPEPGDEQVLVRNRFLSVDPYMRGRMRDAKSYTQPYQVGEVMTGAAVGEVVDSRSAALTTGDWVLHDRGWREYSVVDAVHVRKVDPAAVPSPSLYLGALGMPGLTAYVGIVDIAAVQPGDMVFVSAAAGGVGAMAGQLAKLRGAKRVIGSAGSDAKVQLLTGELGFDSAFNYRSGPVTRLLRDAAPDGIEAYFDNVGGEHLEAAIDSINVHGRIAVCGMISQYNATEPPAAPRNLQQLVVKRFTMRGFLVSDHWDRMGAFLNEVGPWLREGRIATPETVVVGIEQAPAAFLSMLSGGNTGKMVVRL
jgi:NADPH-dependent curcumin reductase CurA